MKSKAFIFMTLLQCGLSAFAAETSTYVNTEKNGQIEKSQDLGVGAKWGTLTGVTAKYWFDEAQALDATVAFADGNTAAGLDYLWHFRQAVPDLIRARQSKYFVPYVGGGLISAFGSNTNFFNRNTGNFGLAGRVPVGVEFLPRLLPFGVFAEFAPSLGFVPTTYTFISGDIGARYYF